MKGKVIPLAMVLVVILTLATPIYQRALAADTCPYYYPNVISIGSPSHPARAYTNARDITIEVWTTDTGYIDLLSGRMVLHGEYRYTDSIYGTEGSGSWTAGELYKFQSYGCDDENGVYPGGRAAFKIHLIASDGAEYNGSLDIENSNGQSPPAAIDGIRMVVKSWGVIFDLPYYDPGIVFFTIL